MKTRFAVAVAIAISIPVAYADSITVNSGAGVTFLDSLFVNGDFSAPFSGADFLSAQTGTGAFVQASVPFYVASLPLGPSAQWIGTNSTAATTLDDTALYAISFNIPDQLLSGSLTLYYAVDNTIGHTNPGIYLNGNALPSSTGIGNFDMQYTYTDLSVGSDLVQGTNWLYIDGVNLGGPGGVIFSANVTTINATPEPGSFWLFLAGLMIVGAVSWRLRKSDAIGLIKSSATR